MMRTSAKLIDRSVKLLLSVNYSRILCLIGSTKRNVTTRLRGVYMSRKNIFARVWSQPLLLLHLKKEAVRNLDRGLIRLASRKLQLRSECP